MTDVIERDLPRHLRERPIGLALKRTNDPIPIIGHTMVVGSLRAHEASGERVLPVG